MSGEILIQGVMKSKGGERLKGREPFREQGGPLRAGKWRGQPGEYRSLAVRLRGRRHIVRICGSSPAVRLKDRRHIVRICGSSPAVRLKDRRHIVRRE